MLAIAGRAHRANVQTTTVGRSGGDASRRARSDGEEKAPSIAIVCSTSARRRVEGDSKPLQQRLMGKACRKDATIWVCRIKRRPIRAERTQCRRERPPKTEKCIVRMARRRGSPSVGTRNSLHERAPGVSASTHRRGVSSTHRRRTRAKRNRREKPPRATDAHPRFIAAVECECLTPLSDDNVSNPREARGAKISVHPAQSTVIAATAAKLFASEIESRMIPKQSGRANTSRSVRSLRRPPPAPNDCRRAIEAT